MVGELWFRGPSLMEGYYGRERAEVFTADGWYRTGDLFRVDDDGYFYFLGRRGDMIKTAGANVSPREVEAALREVTGGLGALVLGLPDAERGQVVGAVVLAGPDDAPDIEQVRQDLRAGCRRTRCRGASSCSGPTSCPMLSSGQARPAPDHRAVR